MFFRNRRPLKSFILLASLISCTTTQTHGLVSESASLSSTKIDEPALAEVFLTFSKDSTASKHEKLRAKIENNLEKILSTELTAQDRLALASYGSILHAYELLKARKTVEAQNLTREIFKTPGLTPQTYRWALSAHAIADAMTISANDIEENLKARTGFNEFNAVQCAVLCGFPGWKILAEEDPKSLTARGYLNRVVSTIQFEYALFQRPDWLKNLDDSVEKPKLLTDAELEKLNPLQKMKYLFQNGKWNAAVALANDTPKNSRAKCDAAYIYAQNILALHARRNRKKDSFLLYSEKMMTEAANSKCTASAFEMNEDNYYRFLIQNENWLARLHWERGANNVAFDISKSGAETAAKNQIWDQYLESLQIAIGRVGLEFRTPLENSDMLAHAEKLLEPMDEHETLAWIKMRKGFFLFLDKKFDEAIHTFTELKSIANDEYTLSQVNYWTGKSFEALGKNEEAKTSYLQAGNAEPLGYYDNLSGQKLKHPSGRASTMETSPFKNNWREEQERWVALEGGRPFVLFRTFQWIKGKFADTKAPQPAMEESRFTDSVRASVLLASALRFVGFANYEEYANYLRDSSSLTSRILKSEANWLKQTYSDRYLRKGLRNAMPEQIAWLLHVTGDYVNSILFVGSLRKEDAVQSSFNPFLYFIFYPRPYESAYKESSKRCNVDEDLLYAISRQESLFQRSVVSSAGAIGLMQLLPSTAKRVLRRFDEYKDKPFDLTDKRTNTLAGACYISDLLKRYNGNLAYTIAAYNAGEENVDKWVTRRNKSDLVFFIEFIPFGETQKYVQRVLRNYYNLKWIYSDSNRRPIANTHLVY